MENTDNHIAKSYITARYQETDQMGVIHHSVYPIWFEVGRTDWIKMAGLSYSGFEKMGVMLPLIELTCVYKSFARYEDKLLTYTRADKVTKTRINFSYEVRKDKDENTLIALGKTFHVFADTKLKPINLQKYNCEIYSLLKSMENGIQM